MTQYLPAADLTSDRCDEPTAEEQDNKLAPNPGTNIAPRNRLKRPR